MRTPLWFWEHRYFCDGDIMGEDDWLFVDWAAINDFLNAGTANALSRWRLNDDRGD